MKTALHMLQSSTWMLESYQGSRLLEDKRGSRRPVTATLIWRKCQHCGADDKER